MNKLSPFVLCFAVILAPLLSAAADLPAGLKAAALQARSRGDGKTLFTRLETETTGLDMLNKMDVSHPMSYLYHSGMTTGGVAVADFDGDGKPDIFFAGTTSKNRLYRQMGALGEMKFQDITASAGPIDGGENWTAGAAARM